MESMSPPREPQLLRFGLRQMFFLVTLLSVLCALLVLTEGPWPMVIAGSTLLVGAHVLSTLIGTRLRDTSPDLQRWRAATPGQDDEHPVANLTADATARLELPPTTPLADRGFLNRWLVGFVLAGAALGIVVGGTTLGFTIGPRITWPGWAVGTISCGVLGAWSAFLASSFGSIARHAWRHAAGKGK